MINLDEFRLAVIPRATERRGVAVAAKQRNPRNSRIPVVYAALTEPMTTRQLCDKLGWTTHQVSAALSALKGKGRVENNAGVWQRAIISP